MNCLRVALYCTLLGLGSALSGCGASGDTAGSVTSAVQELTLSVSGWTCGICRAKTLDRLRAIEGVRTVESVRWEGDTATVTVVFDGNLTEVRALTDEVAHAGFAAVVEPGLP